MATGGEPGLIPGSSRVEDVEERRSIYITNTRNGEQHDPIDLANDSQITADVVVCQTELGDGLRQCVHVGSSRGIEPSQNVHVLGDSRILL